MALARSIESEVLHTAAPSRQPFDASEVGEEDMPTTYLPRIKELATLAPLIENIEANSPEAVFEAVSTFGFKTPLELVQIDLAAHQETHIETNPDSTAPGTVIFSHIKKALQRIFPQIEVEEIPQEETFIVAEDVRAQALNQVFPRLMGELFPQEKSSTPFQTEVPTETDPNPTELPRHLQMAVDANNMSMEQALSYVA
jgi:hypothetical protein